MGETDIKGDLTHTHVTKQNGLKVPQTAKLVLKLNRLFLSRRLLEISLQALMLSDIAHVSRHGNGEYKL